MANDRGSPVPDSVEGAYPSSDVRAPNGNDAIRFQDTGDSSRSARSWIVGRTPAAGRCEGEADTGGRRVARGGGAGARLPPPDHLPAKATDVAAAAPTGPLPAPPPPTGAG